MKTQETSNPYPVFSVLVLTLFLVMGCGVIQTGVDQPEIIEPTPVPDSETAGIDLGEIGTIEVGIEPTPLPGMNFYANQAYDFTFDYPETWTLTEADHGVVLQQDTNRLSILYRWADEQIDDFGRRGLGAGDFIYAGKVNFIDQVIPAEKLVYEGKTKAVFYGENNHQIETDNLIFIIVLEDLESDYLEVDLSEELVVETATILESFKRIEGAAQSEPASGLEAYLKMPSSVLQGSREPIIVDFLLENHTQEGLYLLKWYTPIEGIAGDIFEVYREGHPLPYLGILASRGDPTPDSYIYLGPGESVIAEVDISEAYDFSQPGVYTIKFRSPRISHIARSEAEMATTLDELGPVNIVSTEVILEVISSSTDAGQPVHMTIEEAAELISIDLLEKNSQLMEIPPLTFKEIPAEGVWEELGGQVFIVTEGIFVNEAFLIRNGNVYQLGAAAGGQGLTSLAVTDLDRDGQPELLFSYNAGLGPGFGADTQTRVGMFEPGPGTTGAVEANIAFLGLAGLHVEDPTTVFLTVIESKEVANVLRYLNRLGQLTIEDTKTGASLNFQVDPNLPEELRQKILTND